jgi:hypothetical protein
VPKGGLLQFTTATRETRGAMGFRALDNLDAIFAGREPGTAWREGPLVLYMAGKPL